MKPPVVLPPRWAGVVAACQAVADDPHAPAGERQAAKGRIAAIEAKFGQVQDVASYQRITVDPDTLFAHNAFTEGDPEWTAERYMGLADLQALFDAINGRPHEPVSQDEAVKSYHQRSAEASEEIRQAYRSFVGGRW